MSLSVFSIISFLLPLTVSSLGFLGILDNSNKGKSKWLLLAFLFCLSFQNLFDVLTQVDLDFVLMLGSFIYLPISLLYGIILYTYTRTLLDRKYQPETFNRWQLLPSVLAGLFVGVIYFLTPYDQYIDYVKCSGFQWGSSDGLLIAFMLVRIVLYLAIIGIYTFYILKQFDVQKEIYGKFYASYEVRNERYMRQILFSFIGMASIHVIYLVGIKVSDIFTIILNLTSGALAGIIYFSGKSQLDIRRYRMYKLISHEDEVKQKLEA